MTATGVGTGPAARRGWRLGTGPAARRGWRLVGRDGVALRWVGEQYCVPRDLLEVVLARLSDYATVRESGRVGATVVSRAVRRWKALGLAETTAVLVGEPASVWLTADGLVLAGLGGRAVAPSAATVAHRHAVARVRAFLEGADPMLEWRSERELRAGRQAQGKTHLPDAVITGADGQRVAVEVELTPKTPERVAQIISRHLDEYTRVVYFAAPRARATIERAATGADWGARLQVHPYPPADPPGPSAGR